MDWLLNIFYYEGDILKSVLALFGFMFLLLVLLEGFYILKSAFKSVF